MIALIQRLKNSFLAIFCLLKIFEWFFVYLEMFKQFYLTITDPVGEQGTKGI